MSFTDVPDDPPHRVTDREKLAAFPQLMATIKSLAHHTCGYDGNGGECVPCDQAAILVASIEQGLLYGVTGWIRTGGRP